MRTAVFLTWALLLSCAHGRAGAPVTVTGDAFAAAYCHESNFAPAVVSVTPLDGVDAPLKAMVAIEIGSDSLWMRGRNVSLGGLRERLMQLRNDTRPIGGAPLGPGRLNLVASPDAPASAIVPALAVAAEAGFTEHHWVVLPTAQPELPAFPDPTLGREIEEALSGVAAHQRQPIATQFFADAVGYDEDAQAFAEDGCLPATRALRNIAAAPPDDKCGLIAEGIDTVRAECPARAARIVTTLQATMHSTRYARFVTLWDPAAEPLVVPASQQFAALAPLLLARKGTAIHLAVE